MIRSFARSFLHCLKAFFRYSGSFGAKVIVFFTLFRLMFKKEFFQKNNKEVRETYFGLKITGYDFFTLDFLFKEIFVSNEYYFVPKTKQPIIVDCGANIGASVLFFKYLYPNSKIVAFEANPNTFELLKRNVQQNKFNDVELHNVALHEQDGEISFFISENIGTLVGSIREDRGGQIKLTVKANRLSDYLRNYDFVDAVKIDIEGAEISVVKDLFETGVINKVEHYIIEYHHNINKGESGLADFLKKFEAHGYRYSLKTDFTALGKFQDILIHFYKS